MRSPQLPARLSTLPWLLALATLLPACGGDPAPRVPQRAEPGVTLRLSLAETPALFDLPWPSDLRGHDAGARDLAEQLPNPVDAAVVKQLTSLLPDLRGAPQVPVIYLPFDAAPPALDGPVPSTDPATAQALLIDVDPDSAGRGERVPLVARTLAADPYLPAHVLAFAPVPGHVLRPDTRYALVVLRSLGGDTPLGVPLALRQLIAGVAPEGARGISAVIAMASTWDTLDTLGVPLAEVAAATVFTTADMVADMAARYEAYRAAFTPEISGWQVDPDDGADHARFCELHGTLRLPQLQQGTPPFSAAGGLIPDGPPTPARQQDVPVVLNLPKRPMPAGGFPLVMYLHGSGGLSTQVVDRGPVLVKDGPQAKGLGPAHVLAHRGVATSGHALPLNPERHEGATDLTYLSLSNLAAYRGTMRQGTLELGVVLDALGKARIPPSAVAACKGLSLPAGEDAYRVKVARVGVLGQSQGAVYANMVGAVEPRIGAVVPTGSGAHWSRYILMTERLPAATIIAGLLGLDAPPTWLHPTMQVLQAAWEPVETLIFLPRVGKDPLPGHPHRHVYQPAGQADRFYPEPLYDAMALAYDHGQAGSDVWPEMNALLATVGRGAKLAYPVSANRPTPDTKGRTGVVVQFANDGIKGGHYVFQQLDGVKHQYGCFFASFFETGVARLPAPASPVGDTCD